MQKKKIYADQSSLAKNTAAYIIKSASTAIDQRGQFRIALTGGNTPKLLYSELALLDTDWSKWIIAMGDERCVPHSNPDSNIGMATEFLLNKVPVPPQNILSISENYSSPEEAAEHFTSTLKPLIDDSGWIPRFDLILLGLGEDGHVASLFPGNESLDVTDKAVVASAPGVLPPPVDRITFTYPVINAANEVIVLVSGKNKAEVVHKVLETGEDYHIRPANGIHVINGDEIWMLDEAAASLLGK